MDRGIPIIRRLTALGVGVGLLVGGALMRVGEWTRGAEGEVEQEGKADRGALSVRAAWARALPSGLRRVAAGWSWVQARRAWEAENPRALRQSLFAAVGWRPEHRVYWIEGARMLAFDVPQWRGGGWVERRRGVEEALRFLAEAETLHPMAFEIPWEIGWLRGWALADLDGADRALARAAALAPFPRPVVRLRAAVLQRLGRSEEARALLAGLGEDAKIEGGRGDGEATTAAKASDLAKPREVSDPSGQIRVKNGID